MRAESLQHWGHPRQLLVATNLADAPALWFQAVSQARGSGAAIVLVHVLRSPSLQTRFDPKPDSLITTSRPAAAWDVLQRTTRLIETQGVPCEPVLLQGDPVEQIATLVQSRQIDRVLVATPGTRGSKKILRGSVAEALMASLDIPVCVIGPGMVASPFFETAGGRVLLAVSLHHRRIASVRFASELARSRRAQLVLLHVLGVSGMDALLGELARDVARQMLQEMLAACDVDAAHTEILIREGNPVRAILDQGVCPHRDFIVMGASSLSRVSMLLGSSIVHQVIAAAQCPVITVRASDHPEQQTDHQYSAAIDQEAADRSCERCAVSSPANWSGKD